MNDGELLQFLKQCKASGEDYRTKMKPTWDECEEQIRCVPPKSWELKEDWQTKIYIPMQAKKCEIAESYLNKMIFGKRRNFDITGVEKSDEDEATHLTDLIDTILEIGKFRGENNFILKESVGMGTSFVKILIKPDGKSLSFTWRSPYNCIIDPKAGHNFEKARFWIDQYPEKDLSDLLMDARKKEPVYNKDETARFLTDITSEAQSNLEKAVNSPSSSSATEALIIVKGIDGTNDITIPEKYKTVLLDEYWVKVPNEKNIYEDRLITVLNDSYILRNVENIYGCIPVAPMRIKPRKYDFYGLGYVENTRGLQELANSCINIGFDSLKISSMDIIVMDDTKVKDPTSIKYKPLAVWKMKDVNGVKIQRQPMSAISDILRGLTIIDQIDQDASGVTRQAQGAPNLSGEGTNAETLGEYQLKLQAIDQRFLDVGRFIETDYFMRVLYICTKIIMNEKLFSQPAVNDILGMDEIAVLENIQEQDPMTGEMKITTKVTGKKEVPKLDLAKIRAKGDEAFNFRTTGITQFTERLEIMQKLKEGLMGALQNPTLTAMTKIDELWKKIWQVSEVPNYEDFLRSKDEIKELLSNQQAMNQPPQGQLPMGPQGMPPQMGGM